MEELYLHYAEHLFPNHGWGKDVLCNVNKSPYYRGIQFNLIHLNLITQECCISNTVGFHAGPWPHLWGW